jgi:hypothetical protein
MTRKTNAAIAGTAFLTYIAAGIGSMVLYRQVSSGEGVIARIASIGRHSNTVGVIELLYLVECFSALTLAVTLFAITRDEDRDLALMGAVCRVLEGVFVALAIPDLSSSRWLATRTGADAPDPRALQALGTYLLHGDLAFTATFFAVGSLLSPRSCCAGG